MNTDIQRRTITLRNLGIFILLILASGWLGRGLDVLTGNPSAESLGMLLGLVCHLELLCCCGRSPEMAGRILGSSQTSKRNGGGTWSRSESFRS